MTPTFQPNEMVKYGNELCRVVGYIENGENLVIVPDGLKLDGNMNVVEASELQKLPADLDMVQDILSGTHKRILELQQYLLVLKQDPELVEHRSKLIEAIENQLTAHLQTVEYLEAYVLL